MSRLSALITYGRYRLRSKDAHGIHSPFVFHLYNEVIANYAAFYEYEELSVLRAKLLNDQTELSIEDFGAGSKVMKSKHRKIADICKHGISNEKYAQLLFRLVNFSAPQTIIELGTSVGLTTMYLAAGTKNADVFTIEGSTELSAFAKKMFEQHRKKKIHALTGTFDTQLPALLQQVNKVDFAYIDGHHAKEPTLHYFKMLTEKCHNNSILVFDDINWSAGMQQAWAEIKKDPRVTLTIDLYFMGIVFFRRENKDKEHFVLRF